VPLEAELELEKNYCLGINFVEGVKGRFLSSLAIDLRFSGILSWLQR
jgi:hypothetical protein